MLLGKITGKITTNEFKFLVENEASKFEYVQVYHKVYDYVLCQILEIEKNNNETTAFCQVIGYKDNGKIKKPRIPFEPDTEVLKAEEEFIKQIINLEEKGAAALIGKLEGTNINVHLDLNKILTMHLSILAKSGSGKSYAAGVLLEEIALRKIPVLVIDTHGEYSSMKYKTDSEEDKEKLAILGIKPKKIEVNEYGDTNIIKDAKPLKIKSDLESEELLHLMPGKLSGAQMAVLYSALKNSGTSSFNSLILSLEQEESTAKFSIMTMIDYLKGTGIFSNTTPPYNDMLKPGCINTINLKGINPDIQEIIVYKISKDLFELRKKNKVPPFFLVIEEAHNYCPERSFGEAKSSRILRNIASEGRKFGLGLCVISQRPARVDKSVLSQCSTQIILKITNPNDLKAVTSSIEGITQSAESEIQNLPIGTAMVTGITEVPLVVNIRPRMTLHGGKSQEIIKTDEFMEKIQEFESEELLPIIEPLITPKDLALMSEEEIKIETKLIPCILFNCKDKDHEYKLLVEMINGNIIIDKNEMKTRKLPEMSKLTKKQLGILRALHKKNYLNGEEIIQATGANLDVEEDLEILRKLDYIQKENNKYKLNQNYIFTKLSKHECFDSPEYKNIKYSSKQETKANTDEILERISKFTNITDRTNCFLVKYEVK